MVKYTRKEVWPSDTYLHIYIYTYINIYKHKTNQSVYILYSYDLSTYVNGWRVEARDGVAASEPLRPQHFESFG